MRRYVKESKVLFKVAGYADRARGGGAGAVTPQAPGLPATLPYPESASTGPRWFSHCEPRAPLLSPPLPAADGAPTRAIQSQHCQLLAPLLAPRCRRWDTNPSHAVSALPVLHRSWPVSCPWPSASLGTQPRARALFVASLVATMRSPGQGLALRIE